MPAQAGWRSPGSPRHSICDVYGSLLPSARDLGISDGFQVERIAVAGAAEFHVGRLVPDQHPVVRPGMRLVAGQAVDRRHGFSLQIGYVRNRMALRRMSNSVLERQYGRTLRPEVVLRQFYLAIQDRQQMFALQLARTPIGTMAFEAERIDLGRAQKVLVLSAMRLMTCCAALFECRLMQMRFLLHFSLLVMTSQAGGHRSRLHKSRSVTGMWIVAVGAVSRGARMLHFRLCDLLRLFRVTGHAEFFRAGLRQHNRAVLRRLVAGVAAASGEWSMRELCH